MKAESRKPAKRVSARMRKTMSEAERALWLRLRDQQLGVKFRRQHPFRDFELDFVCPEQHLVIEIEGEREPAQVAAELARTGMLEQAGYKVLRFENDEVMNNIDDVVAAIARVLPPPAPPAVVVAAAPVVKQRYRTKKAPPADKDVDA